MVNEAQVETTLHPVLEYDWSLMAPEWAVLVTAILIAVVDLFLGKHNNRRWLGALAVLGVLIAIGLTLGQLGSEPREILGEQYRADAFALGFKLLILAAAVFSLVQVVYSRPPLGEPVRGEHLAVMLAAALGAMIMVSSADLIPLYVGLETMSIASYVMAGLHKRHWRSNEAAFKYIVYGAAASATLLYGFSFIYGLTGSTRLFVIGERLPELWSSDYGFVLMVGFVLMLVGFGYKISAVPFHTWAPDVYEGAPIPTVSFLSVVSKAAGFAMMVRVFFLIFYGDLWSSKLPAVGWLLAILSAASMILGTTAALSQVNVKRLLAYSSIAQAGYLLVPFAVMSTMMFDQMLFFLLAYLLMNMGLFTVLLVVVRNGQAAVASAAAETAAAGTAGAMTAPADGAAAEGDLRLFAGLYRRSPWLALATTIFLLSLAGFPFTAGFFGKLYILLGTVAMGNWWLPAVMIVTTVVSYAFYFKIVRQMYLRPAADTAPLRVPPALGVLIAVAAAATLVFGIFPGLAFDWMHQYLPMLQQFFTPGTPAL
ncbi:MAG: NADH-quinone oxidoreductase subunit N [Bacillota bacterium]